MTHEVHRQHGFPRRIVTIGRYPLSTVGISLLFLWLAFGLLVQSDRWAATPAYGNLLIIFPAHVWGLIYLILGVLLIASLINPRLKWLGMVAHTLALVLLVVWEAAFIVRWLTDHKTTDANVGAWAFYLAVTFRSAIVATIDHHPPVEQLTESFDVRPESG